MEEPAWAKADLEGPMSADQTRQFIEELARFVFDNHLKNDWEMHHVPGVAGP